MNKKRGTTKRVAAWAMASVLGLSGLGGITANAADVTVTGDGQVNYVDLSQYQQVLLPTAATMQFALDPQGLSGVADGSTAATNSLAANAGKIVPSGQVSIANYGYYPVKTSVKLYVTDTGKSTLVSSPSEVETDTTRRICLTVKPSSAKTTLTVDETDPTKPVITGTTGYAASSEEIAITESAVASAKNTVYALSGAEYEFKNDGGVYSAERKAGGDYGVASFEIGGAVNKNADWAPYIAAKSPKTLKLNAVFSFDTMTDEEYAYLTDAADSHIQQGTYNLVADAAPDVSATTLSYDPEKGATLPLSLGTGADASTVTAVNFVKKTTKTKTADGADVPVKDAKIAVKGFTTNASGTALNIPAVAAIKTELDKVKTDDPALFDPATSTYTKIAYDDGTYDYEIHYDLVVTFADKTEKTISDVTMIKYQAPTVTYSGAELVKKTTATANTAISGLTVDLGNGGATEVTQVVVNEAKSTATISDVDNTKITVTAPTTINIAASAFKYVSSADPTKVVFTVTFNNGETAEVEVPVAANI